MSPFVAGAELPAVLALLRAADRALVQAVELAASGVELADDVAAVRAELARLDLDVEVLRSLFVEGGVTDEHLRRVLDAGSG